MHFLFFAAAPLITAGSSSIAVFANAGTPLMWAGALHLLFGNLLIGIGEGFLLAILFKRKALRCVTVMVAANYFSAWVGAVLLSNNTIKAELGIDLYSAWRWLWIMAVVSYLMTLLLEWPFVAFCLCKATGWFPKSIWGTLLTQSASYVAIFGWYAMASGTSLYTTMSVVPPTQISIPSNALLYYIADKDGDVYASELDGGDSKRICKLGSSDTGDRLCLRQSSTDKNRWDLAAVLQTEGPDRHKVKTIFPDFASAAVPSRSDPEDHPDGSWFNFGEIPRLAIASKDDWTFRSGFWPIEGLSGNNAKDGRTLHFSLETPFVEWAVRNATQLPGGQVIFQLGENQICILDPDARKIALLVKGRGPVVAMKESREGLAKQPKTTPPSP
jgi:hypothetical protein